MINIDIFNNIFNGTGIIGKVYPKNWKIGCWINEFDLSYMVVLKSSSGVIVSKMKFDDNTVTMKDDFSNYEFAIKHLVKCLPAI